MTKYLVFLGLLMAWEFGPGLDPVLSLVLIPPSAILLRLYQDFPTFLHHSLITLKEMLYGFGLALLFAVPCAILMDALRQIRQFLQPLFVITQCIPIFVLAPLMVLLFNWSVMAIVVTVALMIFFPLTLSIYQGLKTTPSHLVNYFKIHNASTLDLYYKLKFPWAYPHFFSGMKISAGAAGLGSIGGEWVGGQEGLGLLMLESRRAGDIEQTFTAMVCLIFLTLALYGMVAIFRKGSLKRFARFAAILALFTSCSNEENKQMRLVLDWLPNPNHVPLYVGVEKDFFKEEGIDLKILKMVDSGDVLPYLTSRQAEVALFYMPDTLRAIQKGAKVKPIASYIQEPLNCFLFLDPSIKKPSDLKGKKIGYSVTGYGKRYLQEIIRQNGIQDAEMINVSFDLSFALQSGKADAVFGAYYNIEGEFLKMQGLNIHYLKMEEFGLPRHPELILVAAPEFDREESFRKGLQKSIEWAQAHPEESFQIYLKLNPDKGSKTILWERKAWEKTRPLFSEKVAIDQQEMEALNLFLKEKDLF